jgi:hypothetical protein
MTTLRKHTNDSMAWDFYTDLEDGSRALSNFKKQVVLMILEDCKDEIIELTEELV